MTTIRTLRDARARLAALRYELTSDGGGGYEVWDGATRVARVYSDAGLLAFVASLAAAPVAAEYTQEAMELEL
jgi:hypothetical protein